MAHGCDADWAMFCRGRRDDDGCGEPVPLEPADDASVEAVAGQHSGTASGGTVRHFTAPVVGLPYPNADGSSRREAVRGLRQWERVRFVHCPDNPVDANAVAVLRQADGRQLGFLPATLAAEVVAGARAGTRYLAVVRDVTGNGDDLLNVAPTRASLLVLALEPGATKVVARRYLLTIVNGQTRQPRPRVSRDKKKT